MDWRASFKWPAYSSGVLRELDVGRGVLQVGVHLVLVFDLVHEDGGSPLVVVVFARKFQSGGMWLT